MLLVLMKWGRLFFDAVVNPDYAVYLAFVQYQLVDAGIFERYVLAFDDDGVLLVFIRASVVFVDGWGSGVIFKKGRWWRGFLDATVSRWTLFPGFVEGDNAVVVFVAIRGRIFAICDFDVIINFASELLTFLFGSMAGIRLVRGRFVRLVDVVMMMVCFQRWF